jgi:signal transduction histidine kinase
MKHQLNYVNSCNVLDVMKLLAEHEIARLEVLRQYQILDTVCEAAFDDLTLLAAQICKTPVALISLIDECRQWFKSKVGLDAESISREIGFCSHTILQPNELFIVPDTLLNQQFANNPLVTCDPYIRFYAGVPLVTPDGYALGTLCVIDRVPRNLSPEQQNSLRILSRQVMSQFELRRNLDKLDVITTAERQRTEDLISALSHDIRTPLLATRSTLRAMLSGAFGTVNNSWKEGLEDCRQANEEVVKFVETLLDISRHQTPVLKNLNYNILNWENIFTEAIIRSNVIWQQKQIVEYQIYSSLPTVYGDDLEIQRVVQNLLENALRVTEPDQSVSLTVVALGNEQVKISVRDNGPGITPRQKKKLFHRFSQERGRSNLFDLNLYLCRLIVEAHGGTIKCESILGEGSIFWFTLPVHK